MTYKSVNDKTIEELCGESKRQRRDDRRKGYLRAVREMRRFAKKFSRWQDFDLINGKLDKMEGV